MTKRKEKARYRFAFIGRAIPEFFNQIHNERLKLIKSMSKNLPIENLLDVACDNLPLSAGIKVKAPIKIAFDLNKHSIRNAKEKEPSYNYIIASAQALPFKTEVFDFVFAGEMIEHLKKTEIFLLEIKRTLKGGGYFLLDTPNRTVTKWIEAATGSHHGLSVGHVKEFFPKELKDKLETCGFMVCKERGVYIPLSLFLPIPVLINISLFLGHRLPRLSYLFFLLAKKPV